MRLSIPKTNSVNVAYVYFITTSLLLQHNITPQHESASQSVSLHLFLTGVNALLPLFTHTFLIAHIRTHTLTFISLHPSTLQLTQTSTHSLYLA